MNEQEELDFLTAMGESFGEHLVPPIPQEDASPHECCEAVWSYLGNNVTPSTLASLDAKGVAGLAKAFGQYFECPEPSVEQIRDAIAATLFRWPAE